MFVRKANFQCKRMFLCFLLLLNKHVQIFSVDLLYIWTIRTGSAGAVRRQAVDISPLRHVNQAIYLLTTGAKESAFRNIKTIAPFTYLLT